MNRAARERLQRELGLDRSLWKRYITRLGRVLREGLGTSSPPRST